MRSGFFLLQQSCSQHLHGFGFVFVLGLFVLTLHNNPRRDVGQSNGGVRGVDRLPTWTRCPEDIDADIFVLDVDFDGICNRHDGDGRRRVWMRPCASVSGTRWRLMNA